MNWGGAADVSEELDEIVLKREMSQFILVQLDPAELRTIGNKFYSNGDYWNAISAYTKSLARAPAGSELRGLAYANRSAVLLALGYYEECISDAKIALENNYPENLAHKLHTRMAVAYKALGMEVEAEEKLQIAVKWVEALGAKPSVEEAAIKEIVDQLKDQHTPKLPSIRVKYNEPPEQSYGANPDDPKLSAALTVSADGKTIKANRDIKLGDVLLVEEPLLYEPTCVVKEGEACWIYCSECFKMCLNLQPCPYCSWACYCSDECASTAWEKFHKNECFPKQKTLEAMIKNNDNTVPVSFRSINLVCKLISVLGLENCINAAADDKMLACAPEQIKSIFNMDLFQLSPNVISNSDMKAIEVVLDAFEVAGDSKDKLLCFLVKILRIVLGNMKDNFTAKGLHIDGQFLFGQYDIGMGVYPRVATINGSCEPNTHCCFYQKTLVLHAARSIKEGEEIFQFMGLNYFNHNLQERREFWQIFTHECHCDACTGDWPLVKDLVPCHKFVSENPLYEPLRKQFEAQCSEGMMTQLSELTPENFLLCSKIQELYGNKRRGDHDLQYKLTSDFVRKYLSSLTKKFEVTFNERSKENLDHYIPATGIRLAYMILLSR